MENDRYPDSGANRRAYPRSPVVVREARCIAGMDVFFGYATNISRSGLFIATSKRRPVGDIYEVHFDLPGTSHKIKCKVSVVWTRGYSKDTCRQPGIGLAFIDIPEDQAQTIDDWIKADPTKVVKG